MFLQRSACLLAWSTSVTSAVGKLYKYFKEGLLKTVVFFRPKSFLRFRSWHLLKEIAIC